MSQATGMSWFKHRRDYAVQFGRQVPDLMGVYNLPGRLALVRAALRVGWQLPQRVLIRDEFHGGNWSVWGFESR